ncbi:hypothetical protein RHODGE_RHODGE_00477 [Rhodoplanes serenus]|uniref:Uncharacterized protein n=1 Tax=Rhodoplanes serenus TaxID=200615 RepID=A0A3S4B2E5_9BRAD|nr:hypothetical protein [Rhodoplanes serenus]VCU06555.1 hypothetical protein RHODPL_RHODPL_00003 [Rhodoplanes serenus]VCU07378.1 hypothetical protein RHODGE_RHODGE_00477 [Rhodoplanes serenus]
MTTAHPLAWLDDSPIATAAARDLRVDELNAARDEAVRHMRGG